MGFSSLGIGVFAVAALGFLGAGIGVFVGRGLTASGFAELTQGATVFFWEKIWSRAKKAGKRSCADEMNKQKALRKHEKGPGCATDSSRPASARADNRI